MKFVLRCGKLISPKPPTSSFQHYQPTIINLSLRSSCLACVLSPRNTRFRSSSISLKPQLLVSVLVIISILSLSLFYLHPCLISNFIFATLVSFSPYDECTYDLYGMPYRSSRTITVNHTHYEICHYTTTLVTSSWCHDQNLIMSISCHQATCPKCSLTKVQ